MKKFLFLIFSIFLLTGCFDYHEINDLLIIDSIGIDYIDDNYYVYFDVVSSKNNEVSNNLIEANDSNLAMAINKVVGNNNILLNHVNLVILSENVTNKGIMNILDYFYREIDMNTNFKIGICNDVSLCLDKNDDVLTELNGSIKSDDIISSLLSKRKDIGIKYFDTFDDIKSNKVMLFKDDVSSFLIDDKLYNFIVLNKNNILFSKYNNVINIYKHSVSYDVKKDKIIINVSGYGKVKMIEDDIKLSKYESYDEINKMFNSVIYDEVNKFINECIYSDVDILGFKDLYYRKYNKSIESIPYELNVDININKNGSIYEAIYE